MGKLSSDKINQSSGSSAPSAGSGLSAMAQLLAKQKGGFTTFHRGDVVEGTITRMSRSEIALDIHAKAEAIVLERDRQIMNALLSQLRVGDTVSAVILNPESDTGNPIVSLRRYLDNLSWKQLDTWKKEQKTVTLTVSESTKGGFLVTTENGLTGFLPHSHTISGGQQLTASKKITATLLEVNRADSKIIFTQKPTISDEEFATIKKQFREGQTLTAPVINTTPFGVFVSVPLPQKTDKHETIDGLIHISELSWEKVTDVTGLYKSGDQVEVIIIGFDEQAKRIDLSVKRLTEDPFEAIAKQFPVDTKAKGTVTRLQDGNVVVDLGNGVEGVIRKEKVPPTVSYKEGDSVNVVVADLDARRHKIDLVPVLLEKPIGYR